MKKQLLATSGLFHCLGQFILRKTADYSNVRFFLLYLCLTSNETKPKAVVSNLRKTLTILLILSFGLFSCKSEKKYSDYNETDFYEVQGIINYANPTSDPFDSTIEKNVSFTYFLDRPNPKTGIENNLEMFEAQNGYPLIVLVHKDDENISFYGRVGILESLNEKEKDFLSKHIEKKMAKIKKKTPEYIYNALIKDTLKENKTDKK